MTKKNRIEYLVCTVSVLITGFIIYGLIGSFEPPINESKEQSFWFFGCLGGFGFSAIVSILILSVRYFKTKGTTFKVVASVLWPLTFAACVYVGIFIYIPYQIYNIVKIVKLSKEEKLKYQEDILSEN